jgi:hypothetical protein
VTVAELAQELGLVVPLVARVRAQPEPARVPLVELLAWGLARRLALVLEPPAAA